MQEKKRIIILCTLFSNARASNPTCIYIAIYSRGTFFNSLGIAERIGKSLENGTVPPKAGRMVMLRLRAIRIISIQITIGYTTYVIIYHLSLSGRSLATTHTVNQPKRTINQMFLF